MMAPVYYFFMLKQDNTNLCIQMFTEEFDA